MKRPKEAIYYGKKLYQIQPLLARMKKLESKVPDYRKEELKEKR